MFFQSFVPKMCQFINYAKSKIILCNESAFLDGTDFSITMPRNLVSAVMRKSVADRKYSVGIDYSPKMPTAKFCQQEFDEFPPIFR